MRSARSPGSSAASRAQGRSSPLPVPVSRARTRQDAAILNILRGCELALDLANILVRERALGVPQSSRDSFRLIADAGLVEAELATRLQRMIGFRNIAVHQYQVLDVAIVEEIVRRDLDDLLAFAGTLARLE